MTGLGKSILVGILAFTLVFAGAAAVVYRTHRSWEQVVEDPQRGYKKQLDDAQKAIYALQNQINQINFQLQQKRAENRGLQARIETDGRELERARDNLQNASSLLKQDNDDVRGLLTTANTERDARGQMYETLKVDADTLRDQRDGFFQKTIELARQIQGSSLNLRDFVAQRGTTFAEFLRSRLVLEFNAAKPKNSDRGTAPRVVGEVLASSREGLVEISLGGDDGVEVGQEITVYRGDSGEFVAAITLSEVTPSRSVGRVQKGQQKEPVQRGFHATNRVN